MIPPDVPAWLFHDIPLWAFLVALLTRPAAWSRRVRAYFDTEHNGHRK
jgi:hypothetical protein